MTKDPPMSRALATLPIVVAGQETKALDSGASRNFCDVSFVRRLGLNLDENCGRTAGLNILRSVTSRYVNY